MHIWWNVQKSLCEFLKCYFSLKNIPFYFSGLIFLVILFHIYISIFFFNTCHFTRVITVHNSPQYHCSLKSYLSLVEQDFFRILGFCKIYTLYLVLLSSFINCGRFQTKLPPFWEFYCFWRIRKDNSNSFKCCPSGYNVIYLSVRQNLTHCFFYLMNVQTYGGPVKWQLC